MGTNIQWIPWARPIAALYGAIVALPSYRLAPEYKFPFAPRDIWDSVSWRAENASALGADLSLGFVVGGGSAGASLAIVTAHAHLNPLASSIAGVLTNLPGCLSEEIVPDIPGTECRCTGFGC
jgi:acetyl esterase/lipase